jgi:hypothetical protein
VSGLPDRERDALARINTHEAVCAERYAIIISRVARLETLLITAVGALLAGLAGLVITLLTRVTH